MSEQRTISITAYRDKNGRPTCCKQWPQQRCIFLQTRKAGIVWICGANGVYVDEYEEDSSLKPAGSCIVWGEA